MQPADFLAAVAPSAKLCMAQAKVPASVTLAQAILESAWGGSALATQGFNLFGIKADPSWHGQTITMLTHEVVNGKTIAINAPFRKYTSWLGSVDDHAAFLRGNQRYASAFLTTTAEQFVTRIAQAGYATDPNYASALIFLMRSHNLEQYDRG
jgi:flagellar protein FlgJ